MAAPVTNTTATTAIQKTQSNSMPKAPTGPLILAISRPGTGLGIAPAWFSSTGIFYKF
jgi:hypothetical protein